MLTPAECRKLAQSYRSQANESGASPRRATLLRNIANSFSGLANQLEMLANTEQDRRASSTGGV
jgi:hypothetical protein